MHEYSLEKNYFLHTTKTDFRRRLGSPHAPWCLQKSKLSMRAEQHHAGFRMRSPMPTAGENNFVEKNKISKKKIKFETLTPLFIPKP